MVVVTTAEQHIQKRNNQYRILLTLSILSRSDALQDSIVLSSSAWDAFFFGANGR